MPKLVKIPASNYSTRGKNLYGFYRFVLQLQNQQIQLIIASMKTNLSAITPTKSFSPYRPERRLLKASSIISCSESTCSTAEEDRTRQKQKTHFLNKSVEEQISRMKQVVQTVMAINGNPKTSRDLGETATNPLSNLREKGKIIENHQIFRKLRELYHDKGISPKRMQQLTKKDSPKTPQSPKKTESPKKKKESPKKKRSHFSQLSPQPIQHLQQIRQIESFMLDQDSDNENEVSIVQGHGNEVLNWGVCMGKASEFKILKFLDEGKFGKVYLAQSHRNNMIYSIKSIYRSSLDEATKLQLLRQVKIQTYLQHPHIVKLYHFFVDDDCAYLVLQPCLGKNLYQNLKEVGKMGEKLVREIIRQICSAVEFMHKNDIIHRDIKPQNILLHENLIKICDFGWAVHSPLLRVTQCGTPLYTPPEVVSKRPYDSKIDIWSIGILTYELLYGTIPFEIRQLDDMVKIIEQEVYFSHETEVSDSAKDFMMHCLHKDPIQRYSIRQLLEHEFLNKTDKYRWTIM